MNIGQFKNVDGRFLGSVATATLHLPRLGLRPVESDNPRAPAFEIVTLNPGRVWVQIGALWEASTGEGEVFYQGKLDDPSMADPLPIALFGNSEEGYRVAWTRNTRRNRDNFDNGGQRRSQRRTDDGFGEGNATESGQLVGAGAGIDDEIPGFDR
ncbi:DUF736 domain-containing protein [Sphingomonas sp. TX0522]|jgi:uncharacterized protein (DUF736 family)|uniref:DUF736 domain-containing protein n=1 Tax=Sphingomonas sp. TX0522 TaxID=2479205 RepID=UPI0018DFDDED|nr:DUF736 domain-containing protein [Sphingomonas sp. TX0522]MBI0533033.1 DUF736 domain-containing protein [Sphingomonas sp. TX0522]